MTGTSERRSTLDNSFESSMRSFAACFVNCVLRSIEQQGAS